MNTKSQTVFNQSFQEVVEVVGMEGAIKLCEVFGGLEIYIPKMDYLKRLERNRAIVDAYDGTQASIALLAKEYQLSSNQIRVILRGRKTRNKEIEA
ncbi:MAG: Mor transcription activator family protein [Deferribacterales bacterium]